ncbi:Signal transduction histidine kinase [Anaerovirgula multivorans]|uniref:histidine kinase n=2 Tax=Anaerovirgula multivorans TaxID=312168 RepID=A0A239L879_9FIRM|nr:Signal transduction histidine kinase [Anaerovirgula multivorans]
MFSVFLVYPLIYIMNAIRHISQGNFIDTDAKAFKKNGKVKWPYFLYKEVIMNIANVGRTLDKARHDREQLDKSKTEWIAGVSHDLKTPLSYVTGYSSLIMNKDHQWEISDIMPYVEEIYSKGMYIENLIEDLNMTFFIDHIDKSQLKLRQIDLVVFLQNIMVDIANEPKAQAYGFGFESELDELETIIDERLMYRAVFNLLMNAIEHNPEETEITLSLSKRGDEIHMNITDNGVGMDESTLKNIFERYYSKNEKAKLHKGLGLCNVKQIVEAHDAQISVDSALGKGTSFYIVLPAIEYYL